MGTGHTLLLKDRSLRPLTTFGACVLNRMCTSSSLWPKWRRKGGYKRYLSYLCWAANWLLNDAIIGQMRSILAGSWTSSAKLWRSRSKTDGTNNFNFSHRSRFFNYECNNSYNNCIFYLRLYLHFSIYLYSTLSQNSKPWFAPKFIRQLHYTEWPDFGCPENAEMLINFIHTIRNQTSALSPNTDSFRPMPNSPILIHCRSVQFSIHVNL